MNNFDQSSTGVNLELLCFRDNAYSCHLWDENFTRFDFKEDLFQFIDYGNHKEIDILDPDNYNFTKQDLVNGLLSHFECDLGYLKTQFLDDNGYSFSKANKTDLLDYIDQTLYSDNDRFNFYIDHLNPKFELLYITGYCQGDCANIVFSHEAIKEYSFKDRSEFLNNMLEYFRNLFYNSPIVCRLNVDDEEIYIDEYLEDQYTWDRDQVLDIAKQNIDHTEKTYILKWLDDNLPIEPDYM